MIATGLLVIGWTRIINKGQDIFINQLILSTQSLKHTYYYIYNAVALVYFISSKIII